jgi:hypothetical protein
MRKPRPRGDRVVEPSQFEIEIPPRLARAFGISVLTPLTSRVIRCARVARVSER